MEPMDPRPASPPSSALRILLVEDEAVNRLVLAKILTRLQADVKQAADGQEALDVLEAYAPDLVITDLNMPRLDGLGLVRALRARGSNLPVLVLSAHNEESYQTAAAELGVSGFLFKPLKVDKVAAAVTEVAKSLGKAVQSIER